MRVLLLILLAATCVFADETSEKKAAGKKKRVGKPLFDGKTFEGWEGNMDFFRVEGGAVVAGMLDKKIPNNEFLCTKKSYGDFVLTLKVKTIGKGANAGIQIRSQRVPDHHEVSGFQADVGAGWWGKLYDESRRNKIMAEPAKDKLDEYKKAIKSDDWNTYKIRCKGNRIKLWVNGFPTVDYIERDPKIPAEGIIGLQIHGGPACEAWYKDIRIRELK